MKNRFKISRTIVFAIVMIIGCCFVLTSCGDKYGKTTLYLEENTSSGCSSGSTQSKTDWLIEKINKGVDISSTLDIRINGETKEDSEGNTYVTANYKENLKNLILNYANEKAIAKSDDETKINEDYKVSLIRIDVKNYLDYLEKVDSANEETIDNVKISLNGTAGCFDTNSGKTTSEQLSKVEDVKDVYLLGALFIVQVEKRLTELEPVKFRARTVGEFFGNFWNNIFIFPLAWLLYFISNICGGFYIIGLLITTLLVRTLGWPIYAKTNDMSVKMAALQPELQSIQEKYAGKNDPDSQRRMQMEQAQLYKKHKIGIGGCLAPLLQFPIFMAIYRAISRIPYTKTIEGSIYNLNWANELNSNFFGIDLFEDRNAGGANQLIGIIILIILVVGTQVLSQILSQRKQKKAQEKSQENIPAYRRKAYNQTQNSAQGQMKIMLWIMIFMMGMFVWQSKAGLGVYWLIGNLYSMLQMVINNATSAKRLEKIQNKNGIYTVKPEKKK